MAQRVESAKFRRDYITIFAVVFFFLIIIFELTVAVGVPMLVSSQKFLGEKTALSRMTNQFDRVRNTLDNISKSPEYRNEVRSEILVLLRPLNKLSYYLRDNLQQLSPHQVGLVAKAVEDARRHAFRTQLKKPISGVIELDIVPVCNEWAESPGNPLAK